MRISVLLTATLLFVPAYSVSAHDIHLSCPQGTIDTRETVASLYKSLLDLERKPDAKELYTSARAGNFRDRLLVAILHTNSFSEGAFFSTDNTAIEKDLGLISKALINTRHHFENMDEEIFSWLQNLTTDGDYRAAYLLSFFYQYGRGTEKDMRKAIRLRHMVARHSACAGDTDPLFPQMEWALAEDLWSGKNGLRPDRKEALEWYEKAAVNQARHGQFVYYFMLGAMYHHFGTAAPEGFPKDYAKARIYFLSGQEIQDEPEFDYLLGLLYEEGGYGLEKNADTARSFFGNAAASGYIPAINKLENLQ